MNDLTTWIGVLQMWLPISAGQLPPTPTGAGSQTGSRPQLFVAQRSQDLGTIIEGDKATVTWILENRGGADLVIDHTVSSCGCTVVQLAEDDKVIRPGGLLHLKAEFDSTNRRDAQAKTINVLSNDPSEPELKLDFKANVELLFEMEPAGMLNVRAIRRGAAAPKTLDIFPGPGRRTLTLRGIEMEGDAPLGFRSEPFESRGRTGQRIQFTVNESASLGALSAMAKIRLTVDGIDRERLYPIRGEIVADLTWLPKVVDATRQTSLPGKRLAPVTLSSTEKTPFDVLGAAAGPLLDVTVEPSKILTSRTEYSVLLTLRDDARPGPFAAVLQVRTTSLDQPVVSIPVFGIVAALVEVDPPMVLLRNDGTANGGRRRVKLQAAAPGTTLEISGVVCDDPAVTAVVDREAGSRYTPAIPQVGFFLVHKPMS
ncbi:MAG: DUF1573 domain-containing protein [Planctomycetota bacterium]